MSYANAPTKLPHGLTRDWYFLDPELEGPLPSAAQRVRVLGSSDELGFRLSGATDFNRIRRAAEAVSRQPLSSFESVLDWGVGCGRIARHALRVIESGRFTGCDIDCDNVEWCRANLGGTYRHTSVEPPLPFPSEAFDLLYGV